VALQRGTSGRRVGSDGGSGAVGARGEPGAGGGRGRGRGSGGGSPYRSPPTAKNQKHMFLVFGGFFPFPVV